MIPLGVRDRARKCHIAESAGKQQRRQRSRELRGLRFADSSRTGTTVLDVITREITCGFERAPSLPLPYLTSTSIHPSSSTRAIHRKRRRQLLLHHPIQPGSSSSSSRSPDVRCTARTFGASAPTYLSARPSSATQPG